MAVVAVVAAMAGLPPAPELSSSYPVNTLVSPRTAAETPAQVAIAVTHIA